MIDDDDHIARLRAQVRRAAQREQDMAPLARFVDAAWTFAVAIIGGAAGGVLVLLLSGR